MTKTKPPKSPPVQQVLIVTPGETFTFEKKGTGVVAAARPRNNARTRIVDLSDTTETTFGNFTEFKEHEVADSIRTDPRDYLPREAPEPRELVLDVLPSRNEQDQTAALIGYLRKTDVERLTQNVNAARIMVIEPAILTAAGTYVESGDEAVLLQVGETQLTGLLVSGGKIRARLREIISPTRVEEQSIGILSGLANLGSSVNHIGLLGYPETVEALAERFAQEENVNLRVFTPEVLAQTAISTPSLLNLRPPVIRNINPALPLLAGAAAGFLPGLIMEAMNTGIKRNVEAMQQEITSLKPQVQEADQLRAEIAQIRDIQAKAKEITENRVNWDNSLSRLTAMLPQQSGQYNVKLKTLNATIANPPAQAQAAQSTPNSPATVAAVHTAAVLSKPLLKYDLEMTGVSRYAATSTVTNFEKSFNFQLTSLSRNQTSGWDIRGTAIEKGENQ